MAKPIWGEDPRNGANRGGPDPKLDAIGSDPSETGRDEGSSWSLLACWKRCSSTRRPATRLPEPVVPSGTGHGCAQLARLISERDLEGNDGHVVVVVSSATSSSLELADALSVSAFGVDGREASSTGMTSAGSSTAQHGRTSRGQAPPAQAPPAQAPTGRRLHRRGLHRRRLHRRRLHRRRLTAQAPRRRLHGASPTGAGSTGAGSRARAHRRRLTAQAHGAGSRARAHRRRLTRRRLDRRELHRRRLHRRRLSPAQAPPARAPPPRAHRLGRAQARGVGSGAGSGSGVPQLREVLVRTKGQTQVPAPTPHEVHRLGTQAPWSPSRQAKNGSTTANTGGLGFR